MKIITFILIYFINIVAIANPQISNLIIPVKYFVNHEIDLSQLNNNLENYKKTALVGISGIGKTQLARMYAYKNENKYQIVWFFDGNVDLNEQFVNLVKIINNKVIKTEKDKISDDVKKAKQEVMRYLASQEKWLLVFDNLKINQNDKLQDIIDWEHNGHVIFCSQDSEGLPQNIKITLLNKKDSIKLITDIIGEEIKTTDLEDLIKAFNGNPVLTVQATMFLKENKYMTVQEYINIISKSNNRVKNHVNLVFKNLSQSAQELLQKIALINNQRFSQNILKIIGNETTIVKDLRSVIRFGLIDDIYDKNEAIFEMHDTLKDSVLEITSTNINKKNINDILDRINSAMPQGLFTKYLEIIQNEGLKSNLEVILENAEKYNADIYKIMELRQNLMNYYLATFDYVSCQQMEDWFLIQEQNNTLRTAFMNESHKSVYAWYLTNIGLYEDFAKSEVFKSIDFLKRAKDIALSLENNFKLKFTIFSFLSEMYAYAGNNEEAISNIQSAETLLIKNKDIEGAMYDWVKARIYINQGNYEDALVSIKKNIQASERMEKNTISTPSYVIQSEILNYLKRFQEAYEITRDMYKKERKNIKQDHEIHASILVQLSRAENGLGLYQEALAHSIEAKNIYLNDKNRKNKDLATSQDVDLAASFVAEADCLFSLGKTEQAVESYAKAETIFYNRYRNNMKNMDNISDLYLKGALAACNLSDDFWYAKFSNQLIEKFGENHFRTKELLDKCRR